MGYDYSLGFKDRYLSYNHGWAFRKYINEDSGFRFLYRKPLSEVVVLLQQMLEQIRGRYPDEYQENFTMQENWESDSFKHLDLDMITDMNGNEVRYDGWATTVGNAYYFTSELLMDCQKEIIDGKSISSELSGD